MNQNKNKYLCTFDICSSGSLSVLIKFCFYYFDNNIRIGLHRKWVNNTMLSIRRRLSKIVFGSVLQLHGQRHRLIKNYSKTAMIASSETLENLKCIFQSAVEAVQPTNLFSPVNFRVNNENTLISLNFNGNAREIDISANKRCHLVGFGKAVYGMTDELAKVLGNRLKSGLISIPVNTMDKFPGIQLPQTIRVYEGATNNLPDQLAVTAAHRIVDFVKSLNNEDILFVLISGGGSALLPLPCDGVTLEQKLTIIKRLSAKGASIDDLNRVRIDLSGTKGGKLGAMAKNAGAVISLIISDIIDDPIHLVASGPTVCRIEPDDKRSIDVLQQYGLWPELSDQLKAIVERNTSANQNFRLDNIHNCIIANNDVAVNRVLDTINKQHQIGLIMSTRIQGNVTEISCSYVRLSQYIQRFKNGRIEESEFLALLSALNGVLHIRESFLERIVQAVHRMRYDGSDLYVIAGGEATVEVTGDGLGGRNQELALRFSLLGAQDAALNDVLLLSAGTDGIDGKGFSRNAIHIPNAGHHDFWRFISTIFERKWSVSLVYFLGDLKEFVSFDCYPRKNIALEDE